MFLEIKGEDLAKSRLSWQLKANLQKIIDSMGQASSLVSNILSNNHLGSEFIQAAHIAWQAAKQLSYSNNQVLR